MKKLVVVGMVLASFLLADGKALFAQKCASCHGFKGEKKALGQSEVIAGWDAAKIKEALEGYKGKPGYGDSPMRGVMAGVAKGLNETQIKELAEYIATLK